MQEANLLMSNKMLFEKAQGFIPGGVNSPVRAFKSVGGTPIFMKSAKGSKLVDCTGKEYIDFINSWGPMILGHAHTEVIAAMHKQVDLSTSYGTPTEIEIDIAKLVCDMIPNIDLIRFVSSGTEACMTALRLARGYTNKSKFIKFEGNYHGHADPFLVKAGSGVATLGISNVPGVTQGTAQDTLIAKYNDLAGVAEIMEANKDELAAIIIEPVAGNMGCIPPSEGFLQGLRKLCDQYNCVLIFDEVMTGFRVAKGGVQERYGVYADLVTYGKVIGGGMPVAAFGGKKEIMDHIAPVGNVYQAGTLSGNPISLAAGITTLKILNDNPEIYTRLEEKGSYLKNNISSILDKKGVAYKINQVGSMMSLHFNENEIVDYDSAAASDIDLFNRLFHHLLENGVYLPPSAYESWFLCDALTDDDLNKTLEAIDNFKF